MENTQPTETPHRPTFQQALDLVHLLSPQDQQRLIEQVQKELEENHNHKPVALRGRWKGIDLSYEEIKEARRECWKGLGE